VKRVIAAVLLFVVSARADTLSAALADGRFEDALRMADQVLKQQPHDPRLWTARGLALRGMGRDMDALASFDRALSLDASFLPALKGAAETAYRSRDDRAGRYLARLLSLNPSNETAHAMTAVLAFEARDCRAAIPHFEKSRDQIGRDELASSQFGQCLLEAGRPEEAVKVFERLLADSPLSTTGRYNLAVAQLQAHRTAAARITLMPLADRQDAEALNLLASAQAAEGRLDEAITSLRRAAQLAPDDERNYLDLAILCQKQGALDLAGEILEVGLRRLPGSARLHAMRGVIYAELGDLENATAAFEKAGRLEPDQAYASMGLSVLLGQTGRLEGATDLLRQKLAATPADSVLNYLLADSLLRGGAGPGEPDFQEARKALLRCVRQRPDFAPARAALGKVYLREGNASSAVRELEAALRFDPENRPALSQLILALRALGRNQEAAAAANRLRRQYERDLDSQRVRINAPAESR
jgi:tetratricopeptide (TPR) repeat protein